MRMTVVTAIGLSPKKMCGVKACPSMRIPSSQRDSIF
jgi:hypothetical protein